MSRVFTEEELSLMQKLGLTPAQVEVLTRNADKQTKREAKLKKNSILSEYFLMHIDRCSLCGGSVTTYFKMTREFTNGGEYLHSIPISKEEYHTAENKIQKEARHLTCKCCSENLAKLPQSELISLAITLQRRMIK